MTSNEALTFIFSDFTALRELKNVLDENPDLRERLREAIRKRKRKPNKVTENENNGTGVSTHQPQPLGCSFHKDVHISCAVRPTPNKGDSKGDPKQGAD